MASVHIPMFDYDDPDSRLPNFTSLPSYDVMECSWYDMEGNLELEIGVIIGEIRIESKIATGQFSSIWLVSEWKSHLPVLRAMKVLKAHDMYPEYAGLERSVMRGLEKYHYHKEKAASKLVSPSPCATYIDSIVLLGDRGAHNSIIMELAGASAFEMLHWYHNRDTDFSVIKRLVKDVLHSLSTLHATLGMIHTDIKPDNILARLHAIPWPESIGSYLRERTLKHGVGHGRSSYLKYYNEFTGFLVKEMEQTSANPVSTHFRPHSDTTSPAKSPPFKSKYQRNWRENRYIYACNESGQTKSMAEAKLEPTRFTVAEFGSESQTSAQIKLGKDALQPSDLEFQARASPQANDESLPMQSSRGCAVNRETSFVAFDNSNASKTSQDPKKIIDAGATVQQGKNGTIFDVTSAASATMGGCPDDSDSPNSNRNDTYICDQDLFLLAERIEADLTGGILNLADHSDEDSGKVQCDMPESIMALGSINESLELPDLAEMTLTELLPPVLKSRRGFIPPTYKGDPRPNDLRQYKSTIGEFHLPEDLAVSFRSKNQQFLLCDFSNVISKNHVNTPVSTHKYRAPEIYLNRPFDERIDIWSLGCVLFELVTGRPFVQFICDSAVPLEHDYMNCITEVLGPIPESMMSSTERADILQVDGYPIDFDQRYQIGLYQLLTTVYGVDSLEASYVTDILLSMLQIDPTRRSSAEQLINHTWLSLATSATREISESECLSSAEARERSRFIHWRAAERLSSM